MLALLAQCFTQSIQAQDDDALTMDDEWKDLSGEKCTFLNVARFHSSIVSENYLRLQEREIDEEELYDIAGHIPPILSSSLINQSSLNTLCERMLKYRAGYLKNRSAADNPPLAESASNKEIPTKPSPLRTELEAAINQHLEAAKTGDKALFEQSMSSYAFYMFEQDAQKSGFELDTKTIQLIASTLPDIDTLSYHSEFSLGPTAALVYSQEEQGDASNISFIFIKLVKENQQWRYHLSLHLQSPKVQEDGEPTQFDLAELEAYKQMGITGFDIDGVVQKPPAKTTRKPTDKEPESFWLDIKSYGYQTSVMIDGEQLAAVSEAQSAKKILLSQGKHRIQVQLQDTSAAHSAPNVSISIQSTKKPAMASLFEFNKPENAQGDYTFELDVP